MATDIRPPAYIPQGTFSGYIPPQSNIERRHRLADILAMQGMDTSPVQSPWQALARVAQAGAGAYGNYQAGQMEQQRYKALGEAMRGGMTPEQAFATGDPQLMQYGEFAAQMAQRRLEADRQAEMLRLAQAQDARAQEAQLHPHISQGEGVYNPAANQGQGGYEFPAGEKPLPPSVADVARIKQGVKVEADNAEKVNGAQTFLTNAEELKSSLGHYEEVPGPDGKPVRQFVPAEGANSMFGVYDASGFNRGMGALLNTETETKRRHFEDSVRNLAIQGARMQFGKGSVAPGKAEFYREGLPHLGDASAQAAYDALEARQREAKGIIDQYAAPASPSVDSSPPQHPFQNAPRAQPNVNAGEVARPAQAAPAPRGGYPKPTDPDSQKISDQLWNSWPPEIQQQWIQGQ